MGAVPHPAHQCGQVLPPQRFQGHGADAELGQPRFVKVFAETRADDDGDVQSDGINSPARRSLFMLGMVMSLITRPNAPGSLRKRAALPDCRRGWSSGSPNFSDQ